MSSVDTRLKVQIKGFKEFKGLKGFKVFKFQIPKFKVQRVRMVQGLKVQIQWLNANRHGASDEGYSVDDTVFDRLQENAILG